MSVALPYFYPRPPRGGRRAVHLFLKLFCIFLSTPSARRATYQPGERRNARGFLSTPSARRATESRERSDRGHPISIHALREEGDASAFLLFWRVRNFYPRPPRGGRPAVGQVLAAQWAISIHALREEGDAFVIFVITPFGIFLSTPSARRATRLARRKESDEELISIHALREEGDTSRTSKRPRNPYFYPRPPRGGRLSIS